MLDVPARAQDNESLYDRIQMAMVSWLYVHGNRVDSFGIDSRTWLQWRFLWWECHRVPPRAEFARAAAAIQRAAATNRIPETRVWRGELRTPIKADRLFRVGAQYPIERLTSSTVFERKTDGYIVPRPGQVRVRIEFNDPAGARSVPCAITQVGEVILPRGDSYLIERVYQSKDAYGPILRVVMKAEG